VDQAHAPEESDPGVNEMAGAASHTFGRSVVSVRFGTPIAETLA
jgi:hypothetical protein